ncbi:hypothetical protein C1752_01526 [Acaryochloris thomasi RCC1774]|uniref:Mannosyl-glycoprotein endo-beta-N-acetylglucosamidase-like domain-containing protein n=1 Tax=Acaryochloris thomasi RCC1774 TaxID=1764569 RepID=A0A2W1JKL4_9CYAN|nr:glucosaminidase domain-containing protein [Acaryochloris thomasi]PZD73940.1 hypothetical protein C1752_01526 [Acaryochloris thomasi RCC1774]
MQIFTKRSQTSKRRTAWRGFLGWGNAAVLIMLLCSCQDQGSSTAASAEEDQEIMQTSDPYINRLLPNAKRLRKEYDVPLELTLAIAIHETGHGDFVLGQDNHFGLKCRSNDCVSARSSQWENCADPAPCFDMFAKTITDLSGGDFTDLEKIRQAGYATSPKWTRKVKKIRRSVRRKLKKAQRTS